MIEAAIEANHSKVVHFRVAVPLVSTCASGGHTIGSYHAPVAKSSQHTNIQSTSRLTTRYVVIKAEAVVPQGVCHGSSQPEA